TIARGLATAAAACYLWYLLSFALVALRTTLLAFRLYNVLVVILVCAGLFAGIDLLRWVSTRLAARRTELRTLAALLAVATLLELVQAAPSVASADASAFGDYYPA